MKTGFWDKSPNASMTCASSFDNLGLPASSQEHAGKDAGTPSLVSSWNECS